MGEGDGGGERGDGYFSDSTMSSFILILFHSIIVKQ